MKYEKRSWKRGFLEIVAEILQSLKETSKKKTHITYGCNLDSRALSKYLSIMIHLNLINEDKIKSKYAIEEKGLEFLEHYEKMINLLDKSVDTDSVFYNDVKEIISNLKSKK